MPSTRRLWIIGTAVTALVVAGYLGPRNGRACDSTVRNQAFLDARDIHRLCVIASRDDASSKTIVSRLRKWLAGDGSALNVELLQLAADDESVVWGNYGMPSAPPVLPVTVLVGRDNASNRSFVIDHWEPAPTAEELAVLKSSPAREELRQKIGSHWAVLLYAPASGAGAASREPVLRAVARDWSDKHAPGVAIVRLDRTDPRERTLLAFAGIDPEGPDWVAVAFGRGKLMAPPLVGEEITEANLNANLSQLTEICSCLRPPRLMGVDMPLAWEPKLDKAVVWLIAAGTTPTLALALAGDPTTAGQKAPGLFTGILAVLALAVLVVSGATVAIVRNRAR